MKQPTDEQIIAYLADLLGQTIPEFTENKNKQFSFECGLFAGFKIGLRKKKL